MPFQDPLCSNPQRNTASQEQCSRDRENCECHEASRGPSLDKRIEFALTSLQGLLASDLALLQPPRSLWSEGESQFLHASFLVTVSPDLQGLAHSDQ